MPSAICPYCGCSLARLGIAREDAAVWVHDKEELLFCCEGCLDGFRTDPERYLRETRDWIVCPACLAEKPQELTISIDHGGRPVYFCRCPHCIEEFKKEPERLLERLSV